MSTDLGSIQRTPFWLPTRGGPLAAWLHQPSSQATGALAVICPPIGFELVHTHRTLRRLADELAAEGVAALRFDYHGTGNSPGNGEEAGLGARWQNDIRSIVDFGRSELGARHVTLIGLRLGGLLAATSASSAGADALVLWSPVAKGRRYMREWDALSRVGGAPDDAVIEAGGFVLSRASAEELATLSLDAADWSPELDVLWVTRDDLPESGPSDGLKASVATMEVMATEGFSDMLAEPHFTKIPGSTVGSIVEWVAAQGSREEPTHQRTCGVSAKMGDGLRIDAPGGFREEFVTVPGPVPLSGVWTSPEEPHEGRPPTVILSNSGSVHNIGPNRVYVELSRSLARAGIASLRLDLRNLGESLAAPAPDENHPYPQSAVDDLLAAARWARDTMKAPHVVVGGLCSGAFTAYRAALVDERDTISGCLLINPLTFEWRDGMSLETPPPGQVNARDAQHYRSAFRNVERWKKALRGDVDFSYFLGFVLRRAKLKTQQLWVDTLEATGLKEPSTLARELRQIVESRRRITFLFSSTDPGLELLQSGARRTVRVLQRKGDLQICMVPGADHTFSRRAWRQDAISRVRSALAHYA
ncbi:MAG: alpha/beta fold hydrolase [Dehalococcoidia bacterium]